MIAALYLSAHHQGKQIWRTNLHTCKNLKDGDAIQKVEGGILIEADLDEWSPPVGRNVALTLMWLLVF